jgi:hypothetical protein
MHEDLQEAPDKEMIVLQERRRRRRCCARRNQAESSRVVIAETELPNMLLTMV